MRVLITGVFGYLGSRIAQALKNEGFYVIGVSKDKKITNDQNIVDEWHQFDALNDDDYKIIEALKPEIVLHLISLDHATSEDDLNLAKKTNFDPTFKLLDNLKNSTTLKKFIYISTIHIYEEALGKEITEDSKISPKNMYALTHYLSETAINYFDKIVDFECINLRLSNSYGEPALENKGCWNLVVNNLCKSAVRNNEIIIKSNGEQSRDFIHYKTVCEVLIDIIRLKDKINNKNKTYNLSSGKSIKIKELAIDIKRIYGKIKNNNIKIFINSNVPLSNFERSSNIDNSNVIIYSNKKISNLIKLKQISMDEVIKNIIYYLIEN